MIKNTITYILCHKHNKLYIFLECKVFICDFHREQAWDRWLKKKSNGCSNERLKILSLLRSIARSETIECCNSAVNELKSSSYWADYSNLRDYITRYWLSIKEVCHYFVLKPLQNSLIQFILNNCDVGR